MKPATEHPVAAAAPRPSRSRLHAGDGAANAGIQASAGVPSIR
jgi:hypothetical protein